jgi:hypothetical protein
MGETVNDVVSEHKEVIRESNGRFPKGQSGNPAGRPLGSKSKIAKMKQELEVAIREHLQPRHIKEIVNAMVKEAKGGNVAAAKLILDKVLSNASGSEEDSSADNRVQIIIENYTAQPDKEARVIVNHTE